MATYKRDQKVLDDSADVSSDNVAFDYGRAAVGEPPPEPEDRPLEIDPYSTSDKDLILGIYCQTNWLANHWSREHDNTMNLMAGDVWDLADRVHYLSVTVITTFLIMIIAVAVLLGVVML